MAKTINRIILVLTIASAAFLSSCKPKPITGQVFIVDPSGVGSPLDGIQIVLINAKDADDYLKKKKIEADQQSGQIKAEIEKLQVELKTEQPEYDEQKATNDAYIANQSYTNDPRYITILKESDDATKKIQTLANAITYLRSKYGKSPFSMNMLIVHQYPKEYLDAWHAEDADAAQIQEIQRDVNRIDNELGSFTLKVENEKALETSAMMQKVELTKENLQSAAANLAMFQTPYFYLADFSPTALEISLADLEGNFVIHNPKKGTKIFAKLKLEDANSGYFWLVDLPPKGQKLILSNGNLFKVPQ
jgi:hypothetical protein